MVGNYDVLPSGEKQVGHRRARKLIESRSTGQMGTGETGRNDPSSSDGARGSLEFVDVRWCSSQWGDATPMRMLRKGL